MCEYALCSITILVDKYIIHMRQHALVTPAESVKYLTTYCPSSVFTAYNQQNGGEEELSIEFVYTPLSLL